MNIELYEVLSPEGEIIEIPLWTLKKLSIAHFLYRDHATGLQKIKSSIYGFLEIFDGIDATRPRFVRARDYSRTSGTPSQTLGQQLRKGRQS
jgi:hypothetical protein